MKEIPFENDKYIFMPYSKVTTQNVNEFLEDDR